MAGSGPQQASPPHAESVNVGQPDELLNFEQENHVDNQREGSSRTTHVGKSGYRRKSHLVQEHEQDLQHEIDDLKKKLRRVQQNHIPSNSDTSSNDEEEDSYRNSSETPPSESYSYEEEHSHKRRDRKSVV